MVRKILKWIGYLLLLLVALIALFAACNWTLVSNILAIGQPGITEVSRFQPAQTVKGCTAQPLATNPAALPRETFAAMKAYSDLHKGVGLIVLVDGKVAGEAYRPGADAATRTSSQSMHKTVVAMMIGAAVQGGVIPSADAPIGSLITEWAQDPRGAITYRQLLSMASGLHNASMSRSELAAFQIQLGDVSEATLATEKERESGTFNYKAVDYQIAGTALSRALKKAGKGNYADYLSNTLWCPLGNRDATLWLEGDGGEPRYYAYLDASVRDWAAVGELIRNKGAAQGKQLVPPDWIDAMLKPSPGNPNYGLGIWRGSPWTQARGYSKEVAMKVTHKEAYLADDVTFLDGFGGQRVYVVPSAKLVIARSGETSMTWDDSVMVNLALKGLP